MEQEKANEVATANDPVVTSVGEYIQDTLDLNLGGPLPLGFGRYFGSFVGIAAQVGGFYGQFDSPMGANWVHNFLLLLQKINNTCWCRSGHRWCPLKRLW